jgi:hypothetical protein
MRVLLVLLLLLLLLLLRVSPRVTRLFFAVLLLSCLLAMISTPHH